MKQQQIIYLPLSAIKPYENNPRKNDAAVDAVAASIKEFGARNPIIVDKDNVVICGHTRLQAAHKLGLDTFPVIVAADMSEAQVKAYRLVDNKTNELAEWDIDALNIELDELLEDGVEMQPFGFDFELDGFDSYTSAHSFKHLEEQSATQGRVAGIHNLNKATFEGEGEYDIPIIYPVKHINNITEWIGFNYVLSDKNPQGKGVHFFVDDYQFERLWDNPDKYMDKLRQYECVASPDFSPYGDMPNALQLFNHYRKHWIAAYMQLNGITVIPTIRSSTDERSLKWYLHGEPHGGIVLISSMWDNYETVKEAAKREYNQMLETLNPCKVLVYGKTYDWMGGNVERIKTFTEKRWNR